MEDRLDERLLRLKRRRTMADYPDDYLTLILEDASRAYQDYCNREALPEDIQKRLKPFRKARGLD